MMPSVYVGGDSHAGALASLLAPAMEGWANGRRTADQPALPLWPDVVVVSLGTNDRPSDELAAAVRALAESREGRPLVWVLPPRATRADVAERRPEVVQLIRDGLEGIPGVSIVDPAPVPLRDGVHATPAGYRTIAGQIEAAIGGASSGAIVVPLVLGGLIAVAAIRWFYR